MFVKWFLENIGPSPYHLKGHCNAGTLTCKEQGYYGPFKMWLNSQGIANLLSIPQLEEEGYKVDYNTDRDWVVTTPEGKDIKFERDTGLCNRMPFIDLRKHHEGIAMLETVRANFEGYTKKQVERAILARRLQSMLAHPPDEKLKELVSNPGYDTKVTPESITNAKSIFGPNRARLVGATVRKKPTRLDIL